MSIGTFSYPMPVNEPVLNYAPGSAEKKRLKEVLAELKSSRSGCADVYREQRSKNW